MKTKPALKLVRSQTSVSQSIGRLTIVQHCNCCCLMARWAAMRNNNDDGDNNNNNNNNNDDDDERISRAPVHVKQAQLL